MVFWILFVWNILLAAFSFFWDAKILSSIFWDAKKTKKSAEEELKMEEELLPDGLIEEMAGEKKKKWNMPEFT